MEKEWPKNPHTEQTNRDWLEQQCASFVKAFARTPEPEKK